MADPIPTGHRNFGAPNSAKRWQIRVNHGLGDVFDEKKIPVGLMVKTLRCNKYNRYVYIYTYIYIHIDNMI